jgi:hypothetical protein
MRGLVAAYPNKAERCGALVLGFVLGVVLSIVLSMVLNWGIAQMVQS